MVHIGFHLWILFSIIAIVSYEFLYIFGLYEYQRLEFFYSKINEYRKMVGKEPLDIDSNCKVETYTDKHGKLKKRYSFEINVPLGIFCCLFPVLHVLIIIVCILSFINIVIVAIEVKRLYKTVTALNFLVNVNDVKDTLDENEDIDNMSTEEKIGKILALLMADDEDNEDNENDNGDNNNE